MGDYKHANADIDVILTKHPNRYAEWFSRAQNLYYAGEYEAALQDCERGYSLKPPQHDFLPPYTKGMILVALKRFSEALLLFRHIREDGVYRGHQKSYFYMAVCYTNLQEPDNAVRIYDELIDTYRNKKIRDRELIALCYMNRGHIMHTRSDQSKEPEIELKNALHDYESGEHLTSNLTYKKEWQSFIANGKLHHTHILSHISYKRYGDAVQSKLEVLRNTPSLLPLVTSDEDMTQLWNNGAALYRTRQYKESLVVFHSMIRRWATAPDFVKPGAIIVLGCAACHLMVSFHSPPYRIYLQRSYIHT